MSINDTEDIVLATGQSIREAKLTCESYDHNVAESMTRME